MSPPDSDSTHLARFGYRQELHRELGAFSSFAAGFSYISILTGMFATSGYGFLFAGPAFVWTWPVVFAGQMMVALQFAELSAHYPLAGSAYQWSKQVAGRAWAWHTGWVYLWAQLVTVAAVSVTWQIILPQISPKFQLVGSAANSGNLFSSDFAQNAIILGMVMVGLSTIINMAGIHVMSRINNVGVMAELTGAAVLIVVFLINTNRSPGDVLTNTAGTGSAHGTLGYFGALLVGAFMPLYVFYGFDTAGSLAEETSDPRRKAPRAIVQALSTAGVMGFLLILFGAMAVSDSAYGSPTSLGLASITKDVLGGFWGDVLLWDGAIAIFVCCLAIHAMSVRMMFAMGRDNNLPFASRLAHVSGRRRVPVVPALVTGGVAFLLLLFNIYNRAAFQSIIAVGIILIYAAYAGVTIPLLQRRLAGWPSGLPTAGEGVFRLGRWGVVTNAIAVAYGLAMIVNLMWPRDYFYGTLWYQQYGPIVFVALVLGAGLAIYHGYQKTRMGVLDEHRAGGEAEALGGHPPVQAGP
jgi:urea carboxylase system permease